MGLKRFVNRFRAFLRWIGSIGNTPEDSPEMRSHKTIIVVSLYACIANLLYFYFEYIKVGRPNAATVLLISAIYFFLVLLTFSFHRNYKILRAFTFFGAYFYIVSYHTVMGGFVGSVLYIFYAIPVVSGAQILYEKKADRMAWYIVFLITAVILYFLEPVISQGMVPLPDRVILLTYINNFILLSSLVFLAINYYTNILRTEKQKSDILIRNILPDSVVNELNTEGKSKPVMIPSATAIFMDFVGFTRITSEMAPQQLVSILNEHFTKFDQIFKAHNVEKLKTIGDGYMAVGGLPVQNQTHPLDVCLAAVKVLKYIEEDAGNWNLRIGIHTGPMIAGIIGESKFTYDVWGNSVNLSSRLETASMPGCINVSEEVMEATRDFFEFESRGHIEIKNSKPLPMYFIVDIKEPLKSGHFQPNEAFMKKYQQYDVSKLSTTSLETASSE